MRFTQRLRVVVEHVGKRFHVRSACRSKLALNSIYQRVYLKAVVKAYSPITDIQAGELIRPCLASAGIDGFYVLQQRYGFQLAYLIGFLADNEVYACFALHELVEILCLINAYEAVLALGVFLGLPHKGFFGLVSKLIAYAALVLPAVDRAENIRRTLLYTHEPVAESVCRELLPAIYDLGLYWLQVLTRRSAELSLVSLCLRSSFKALSCHGHRFRRIPAKTINGIRGAFRVRFLQAVPRSGNSLRSRFIVEVRHEPVVLERLVCFVQLSYIAYSVSNIISQPFELPDSVTGYFSKVLAI